MNSIGVSDFPDDVKVHLDIMASTAYWAQVLDATRSSTLEDSKQDIVDLVISDLNPSFKLSKLSICLDNGKDVTSSDKISGEVSTQRRDAMIPLSYFRLFENKLGVDYTDFESNIISYSLGANSKVLTYLDGVRKIPIPFDAELVLALSSVMWRNSFNTSNLDQIEYLYSNFSKHFGDIPFAKKTASKHNSYSPQKVMTHIGLSYLDKLNDQNNLGDSDYVAIVFGSCIANSKPILKKSAEMYYDIFIDGTSHVSCKIITRSFKYRLWK